MTIHTADWWQRISQHLDQVLDLPSQDRSAWLSTLRQRDPTLADELELALRQQAALAREGFLEGGIEAPLSEALPVGTVVGTYTIVAPIGQGGMGTVWLGERTDGEIQRRVAIKFLTGGSYRQGWRDRFLRERQLLASLSQATND